VAEAAGAQPFRFPVQWVNRPDLDFRGFAVPLSGHRGPGDPLVVMGSGRQSRVKELVTFDGRLELRRDWRRDHPDPGRRDRHSARRPPGLASGRAPSLPTSLPRMWCG